MPAKRAQKVEGFFWVAIGAIICIFAWKAHLGSFLEPGPGFVPFLSGLFIAIVGLIMLLSQILSKMSQGNSLDLGLAFRNISWFRLVFTMVLLFGYAVFLNTFGYIITTFLTMWGLFYDQEKHNWATSLMASSVTVGGTYLVFEIWLRCQLPRGIFPWW
jgi:putative tricarboxylic transport membrane protein